jgi:hypothetical protein
MNNPNKMTYRIITISHPGDVHNEVKILISKVKITKEVKTIYDSVSFLVRDEVSINNNSFSHKRVKKRIRLHRILNIHNDDGIKDFVQIGAMIKSIKSGEHIHSFGIPNIKLVVIKERELLLFDGHHSMLAYMLVGKKYLNEIPHLIIKDEDKGYIQDKDILVFYGKHAKNMRDGNWREYVINWQTVEEKQLSSRIQKNMGELFSVIISKLKFHRF